MFTAKRQRPPVDVVLYLNGRIGYHQYSLSCCPFSFWPLLCLSFDLRLLITPLISLSYSFSYSIGFWNYLDSVSFFSLIIFKGNNRHKWAIINVYTYLLTFSWTSEGISITCNIYPYHFLLKKIVYFCTVNLMLCTFFIIIPIVDECWHMYSIYNMSEYI